MLITWLPIAPDIAPWVNPLLDRETALIVSGISAPRATRVAPRVELSTPPHFAMSAQKYMINDASTPIHKIQVTKIATALYKDTRGTCFSTSSSSSLAAAAAAAAEVSCFFLTAFISIIVLTLLLLLLLLLPLVLVLAASVLVTSPTNHRLGFSGLSYI